MPTYSNLKFYLDSPTSSLSVSIGGTWTWTGEATPSGTATITDNEAGIEGQTMDDDSAGNESATADVTTPSGTSTGVNVDNERTWTVRDTVTGEVFEVIEFDVEGGGASGRYTLSEKPLVQGRSYETLDIDSNPDATAGDPVFTYADYDAAAFDALGATVEGTAGDDVMGVGYVDADGDQIGAGSDEIDAGDGDDSVDGGAGDDTIFGGAGNDTLSGGDGGGGGTTSIAIDNSSFDDVALSNGGSTATTPGWTVIGGGWAGSYDAVDDAVPTDGENVAYVYGGAGLSQTLSTNFDATSSYDLSLHVVTETSAASQNTPYEINLYAGNTLIGTVSGSSAGTAYQQDLVTISVDGSAYAAADGGALRIEITSTGSSSNYVLVDQVQLTQTGGDVGDDVLDGGAGDDVLDGGDGDDTLYGGAGNDTLSTGSDSSGGGGSSLPPAYSEQDGASDSFTGTNGNSSFTGTVTSNGPLSTASYGSIDGYMIGASNDTVETHAHIFSQEVAGAQILFNDVQDQEIISLVVDGAFVDLNTAISEGWVSFDGAGQYDVSGSGQIVGLSSSNSQVVGTLTIDRSFSEAWLNYQTLSSGDGVHYEFYVDTNPPVSPGSDADLLDGGDDADTFLIEDGFGADTITGGEGVTTGTDDDVIDASALTSGVDITLSGTGAGYLTDGADTLSFSEIEGFGLTDQDDTFDGSSDSGGLTVDGGGGSDTITGGAGDDDLDGGLGDDTLYGGAGADTISGGAGGDSIEGGAGDDALFGEGASEITFSLGGTSRAGVNPIYEVYADGVLIFTGEVTWAESPTFDSNAAGAFQDVRIPVEGGLPDSVQIVFVNDSDPGDGSPGGDRNLHVDNLTVGDTTYEAETDATPSGGAAAGDNYNLFGTPNSLTFDTSTAQPVSGDDTLSGGDGSDTFYFTDNFGNDSVVGGDGGSDFDIIDLSGISGSGVTVTFTGDEAGTITDGTDTITGSEIERVITTDQDDVVDMADNATPTTIAAGAGDDSVSRIRSNQSVEGGDGNDTLTGEANDGAGTSTLDGGAGNDSIDGGDRSDLIYGGSGNDRIEAGEENSIGDSDTIYGGDGNDTITSAETDHRSDDQIYGEAGDDSISVAGGDNFLSGGSGEDTIRGGIGDDTMEGGADADTFIIEGGFGSDVITGGEGTSEAGDQDFDTIDLSALTGAVTVNYTGDEAGTITDGAGNTITFTEIERIILTDQADVVDGRADTQGLSIDAGAGDDTIDGGDGSDTIQGGAGTDRIDGRSGNDSLKGGEDGDYVDGGSGNDTVEGGVGDDTLEGSGGADSVSGGTGNDYIVGYNASGMDAGNPISVSAGDDGASDTLDGGDGEDTIIAGSGDDSVSGGADNDRIDGGGGNDSIDGGTGSDTIEGGSGDDTIQGGDGADALAGNNGADSIEGGAGNDTIAGYTPSYIGSNWSQYSDDGSNDTLSGGGGNDQIFGGAGDDSLDGGDGNDRIRGMQDDDTIDGGDGNDTLQGESGADSIRGGAGNDRLEGGSDDDTLQGGTGSDTLTGGDGDDTFVFEAGDGADTITDFNAGNTGALGDGDTSNNDFIDLSQFYTDLAELRADFDDDQVLNQSTGDFSDNTAMDSGDSLTFTGATRTSFTDDNTGVVCFASGTLILTERGEAPVERLRPGDRVVTMDNGPQPVAMIPSRRLDAGTLARHPDLKPIEIKSGALGGDRKLIVSPAHAMLVRTGSGEALVSARQLSRVNGGAVRVMAGCRGIAYFHLVFDAHQIVFANGRPTESFSPGPRALRALNPTARREYELLFPDIVVHEERRSKLKLCLLARDRLPTKCLPNHLRHVAHPTSVSPGHFVA